MDKAEWARAAAAELMAQHGSEAAIETADYRQCSFILSAAALAMSDRDMARRIGEMMDRPRDAGWTITTSALIAALRADHPSAFISDESNGRVAIDGEFDLAAVLARLGPD